MLERQTAWSDEAASERDGGDSEESLLSVYLGTRVSCSGKGQKEGPRGLSQGQGSSR